MEENLTLESLVTSKIAKVRLIVGLLQGIVLYLLYRATQHPLWPATEPYLFVPLLLASLMVPVILISSLGHLNRRQLIAWIAVVVLILTMLGIYNIWRIGSNDDASFMQTGRHTLYPSLLLIIFSAVGFFIAQALVLAGASEQRYIAHYPSYFEIAWKLMIQLAFSVLFVGVLWLVLWLGAGLFSLVKLTLPGVLLTQKWFAIPVTVFAFSCAMHITDVRPAIVHGIRTLLLVLLSWILPIATLIVVGFLASLVFTGLAPLWATRHATAGLIGAVAVLVLLINTAFQNGQNSQNSGSALQVAKVIRISARVAALLLLPIVALALYALSLRIDQYGLTTGRAIAAACLVLAICYAFGYAWASCCRDSWLAPIATVNVITACVTLALLLALFSPLADPARLSVKNQVARLTAGRVTADAFDFGYLKSEGARYGMAALNALKGKTQGADAALVRERAQQALQQSQHRTVPLPRLPLLPTDIAANIRVWPPSAHLPESFVKQTWNPKQLFGVYGTTWSLPPCLTQPHQTCDAYLVHFDRDHVATPEVLLVSAEPVGRSGAVIFQDNGRGYWTIVANLPSDLAGCPAFREKMQAGEYQLLPSRWQDLKIGDQRIEVNQGNSDDWLVCRALR
jgi:hypothetical protein